MKLVKTNFDQLIIIKHKIFSDERGFFKEIFKKNDLERILGYNIDFCQENSVNSYKNVLRGLHFQKKPFSQSKLISVSAGKIFDVVVDIRKNSKTYGQYFSKVLSAEKNESLFIPAGFAHGYLTLSENAIINYKVDNYYNKNMEDGISFDDEYLNIDWGLDKNKMILSKKDRNQKSYSW